MKMTFHHGTTQRHIKKGDKVYYFYDIYIAKCNTQGHPEDGDWYDPTEENEHGQQI